MMPGQYTPGSSPLHRLGSFPKILCFGLITAGFLQRFSVLSFLLSVSVCFLLISLSRLPMKTVFGGILSGGWFFLFILLMNFFFFRTEDAYFSFWIFTPTKAGLLQGLDVVSRVILLILLGNLLICTTSPIDLMKGIRTLISPLKILRLPVEDISMILSIALQFVPTLLLEASDLQKAQTARGAGFEGKGLRNKIRGASALLIPLFLTAVRRADELALAMEARGFRRGIRRRSLSSGPAARDILAILLSLAFLMAQIFL